MRLHKTVEPVEVTLATVGYANGFGKTALYHRQGIELAFGNVADVAFPDGVDVVRNQLRSTVEAETLVDGAELFVY